MWSVPGIRGAVALLAVALVAAACGSGEPANEAPTIEELRDGAVEVDFLAAQSDAVTGRFVFTFGLVVHESGGLVTGGRPQLWIARDETTPALGPFPAAFHRFTPDPESEAPRSPLPGFYAAEVEIPGAGDWLVAAAADLDGQRHVGARQVEVTDGSVVAQVGTEAISVETPVGTTEQELREICTRPPPDPMHYISLDEALTNGKPTVVSFATPLLCESQLCGPVVDEVLAVFEKVGPERANFIHVEEFLPGEDLQPPSATHENASEAFKAWGFQTEPWTIVIDGEGIIRARFEGPVSAALVEAALAPLL